MKTLQLQIQLKRQLWQFGLNPQEWQVKRCGPDRYSIYHRADGQAYFWGKVQKTSTRLKWKNLQVVF